MASAIPQAVRPLAVIMAGLLLAGLAARPFRLTPQPASDAGDDARAALASPGTGFGLAILGGWRSIAADFLWLRVQAAWEARDLPATQTAIRIVTQVDPRPLVFWLNGARMLAYDMPEWRIEERGGHDHAPASWIGHVYAEHARLALDLLASARARLGDRHELWVEAANIHAGRLNDYAGAAECFRRAALLPDSPHYAARMHAELLRKAGRPRDALDWLIRLHPTLPADDERAMADVVLGRIRELEEELQVPPLLRYRPPARTGG